MDWQLNRRDLEVILESLEYTKMNVTHGKDAPYEVKRAKLDEVDKVMVKVRALRDSLPKE